MAEKLPPSQSSTSAPFPGSLTAGWNDPPMLQHNLQNSGRPRLNLKKRIAFPLQVACSASFNTLTTTPVAVEPITNFPPITPVPQPVAVMPPVLVDRVEMVNVPGDALEYSLGIFQKKLETAPESLNECKDDIGCNLSTIEQSWRANKISVPVQRQIYQLARAISENAYEDTMDDYTNLVKDHSSESSHWAKALRHIVWTMQTDRNDNLPSDNTEKYVTSAMDSIKMHDLANISSL